MGELNAFFEDHRRFVLSTLFLTVALLFAGYMILYVPRQVWIGHLNAGIAKYQAENKKMQSEFDARKRSSEQESNPNQIKSLPDFLSRINKVANETGVIIQKLTPDEGKRLRFTIQIIDTYFKFIRFSSILESLNVRIHDIQVHPYNLVKNPPQHVITFSLTPRNDAQELSGERLSDLKRRVAEKDQRNPFQRFVSFDRKVEAIIDLTWVYRLTGIGRIGQRRFATIDSKDYSVDEEMAGMKITHVDTDRVRLEKVGPNGIEKYQLKFRKLKKKTGKPGS